MAINIRDFFQIMEITKLIQKHIKETKHMEKNLNYTKILFIINKSGVKMMMIMMMIINQGIKKQQQKCIFFFKNIYF